MANNYNFYANESSADKDDRVEGRELEKLYDKYQQINKQTTTQIFNDSKNDDSSLRADDEQGGPYTLVSKKYDYRRNKNQRGDRRNYDYDTNDYRGSYNIDNQHKSNNCRIYVNRTVTNDYVNDSSNRDTNYSDIYDINKNKTNNKYLYHVNNQAISYATDLHLTPLRIKCNPILSDRNLALKFVKEFFKKIENSFKNIYSDHKNAIGFDYWWINNDGDLVGITKDISLYIYLCDVRHYPEQIDSVHLTPMLPIHLPPQHAIVIKYVPNKFSFLDIEDDLKLRYSSIYHIGEMNGTRRTHSRHIRMDIYDKAEYNSILNSGTITISGLLCDVDEYLPAPKILICTKCNCPGHTKKVCRLDFDKCRRCGNDRNNGEHKQCSIICHHCGGDHQANDYKCPILLQFRRDLIEQLRGNPGRLPPHVQLFIPLDCRTPGSEKILTNQNINNHQEAFHNYTNNTTCTNLNSGWAHPDNSPGICKCNTQLKDLQINLDSLKLNYQLEMEKINNKFDNLYSSVQKTYLLMQSQMCTHKEMTDSASATINDIAFKMNMNVINIMNDFIQLFGEKIKDKQTKNKLNMWQADLKIHYQYIIEKQTAFNNHMNNLNELWLKQSTNIAEVLDLHLPSNNNDH